MEKCLPADPVFKHDALQSSFKLTEARGLRQYFRSSLVFRSVYDDMIERWQLAVGAENLLVLLHEDFYYDPNNVLLQISEFLEIDEFPEVEKDIGAVGEEEMKWDPLSDQTYDSLIDFFTPFNNRLFSLINRTNSEWKYHRSAVYRGQEQD